MDYVNFMRKDLGLQDLSPVAAEALLVIFKKAIQSLSIENKKPLRDYFQGCFNAEDDFTTKHVSLTSIIAANMVEDSNGAPERWSRR